MEHAKKLILVEPRVLEQMKTHVEYRELQKPSDQKTKAGLSLELQQMLENRSMGDDIKAKMYRQKFYKFQKTRSELPPPDKGGINPLTPPVVTRPSRRSHTTPRRRHWDQY